MHEVLVNCLGGLSLPRKSVVRLTDRPDMTLDVYRGRKTTIQQQKSLEKKTVETPEPSFTKQFHETKFVNAMKSHSAANFEGQIHVVNGFVKLVPELMDGWMTCKFTSFSTVSQSYQKGNWTIMKGYAY